MNAREEKRAAFNEQMNEWVSHQGFWFQLRHAADGQSIIGRLSRIALRLLIVLVLLGLVAWWYLNQRVTGHAFGENIETALKEYLPAKEVKVEKIRKERGVLSLGNIAAAGDDESFFHSLSARQANLSMKLTDGIVGSWNSGVINVSQLSMHVKAGEDSDSSATTAYNSLFTDYKDFSFSLLESNDTTIKWGYSKTNLGSIANSHMTATRTGGVWNLVFVGGTFSQNWLKNIEIKEMKAICDGSGVRITEAKLHCGAGVIHFQANVGSGSQPAVSGSIDFKSVPVSLILPSAYHDLFDGTVSGEGIISGSTNSQNGIEMSINLDLADGDVLVLRDNLPILSALTVVDVYNSYRKISFTSGGARIRTGGDALQVDQITLKAGKLLHLAGGFNIREPSYAEIAKALGLKDVEKVKDIMNKSWAASDDLAGVMSTSMDLDQATQKDDKSEGNKHTSDMSEQDKVMATAIMNEKNTRRYGGNVKLGLSPDAFDKAPKLKATYPVDPSTARIWMDVPLNGRRQNLTFGQAKLLYKLGKNRE